MYAVIRAGGKQYRVAPGDVIRIETSSKTQPDANGKFQFDAADVLAISPEPGKLNTKPNGGAAVTGQVVDEGRAKKILVFHFKRKKQYKKMQGHRQAYTAVRIAEIAFDGKKATAPELAASKSKAKKAKAHEVAGTAPVKSTAAKRGPLKKATAGGAKKSAPKAKAKTAAKKTTKKK
jgi:large subunit ribosomal protein L21